MNPDINSNQTNFQFMISSSDMLGMNPAQIETMLSGLYMLMTVVHDVPDDGTITFRNESSSPNMNILDEGIEYDDE